MIVSSVCMNDAVIQTATVVCSEMGHVLHWVGLIQGCVVALFQWVAMATQATSFTSYCSPRLFCFLRTVHNYIR